MSFVRTLGLFGVFVFAFNTMAQPSRIAAKADDNRRVTLAGHINPRALRAVDQGRVSPNQPLTYVTLALAPSDAQKAELAQLLAEQQTPGSSNYHLWLTPEQYAERFGVSDDDLRKIEIWLQAHSLTVVAVARGRNSIAFNGSAAQVEAAFQIELHQYLTNGEYHFANSTEPSIPAAFAGVVTGIRGLNDFRLKPSKIKQLNPEFTSGGSHFLAPGDFATIYDITPLYNAGIDGTGQTLVVAGQTQVSLTDIETFRSTFKLSAKDPQIVLVPGSTDPGVSSGDLPEADLDLEWSGAVAKNATVIYVYTADVLQSVQYAIDQDLAPVISLSYGLCELETPSVDATIFRSWAQQGNAEGITWFSASGDAGAADCNDTQNPGLAVDSPADIPEVTGIGGTEFAEGSGAYWNSSNATNLASALSYIPEMAWNDSAQDGQPTAGGGGASVFFQKPAWQTGPGVPADNARHVPDLALTASANHDGYLVFTSGKEQIYGGTSAPTPSFAGIAALLNQYLVSKNVLSTPGLGNINPNLYSLAQTNPGVFHDVTTGNNIVTVGCSSKQKTCTGTAVGYNAGSGYDQATGLGSVDAYKLATVWTSSSTLPVTTAQMISPTAGSTFASTTQTFTWTAATGATQYWLDVGTVLGEGNIQGSATTATSMTVTNIPCTGQTIYTQLWTYMNGAWISPNRYTYTACTAPSSPNIASPVSTSILNSPSQTFSWNPVSGADQYWLDVGSQVATGDYYGAATTGTSITVNTIPCDGRTVYVQLWVHINGGWQPPQRSTYTGASGCAALASPTDGAAFAAATMTFSWGAAAGADQYWLDVGNSIAHGDIFGGATTSLSTTVSNIPCDGRTIYVQLWTHIAGAWKNPGRYEYTAWGGCGKLTSPVPGSTLAGSAVTFSWTPGTGVQAYWLDVGTTFGQGNIFGANVGTVLSKTVSGIPSTGQPIYVRLWAMISGVWHPNAYLYTAF